MTEDQKIKLNEFVNGRYSEHKDVHRSFSIEDGKWGTEKYDLIVCVRFFFPRSPSAAFFGWKKEQWVFLRDWND